MVKADLTRDYYGDLEVPPTADVAEIKKQFKKLALAYHPDRNPGRESEVTARFQRIQSAHEVLIDATERAKYDANRVRVSASSFRNSYAGSSGVRGNPWSNVSAQYPPPPKPPTASRKPPPPSSGAERYRKNFQAPPASAYQAAQEGPEARKSTYEAWSNLRHNTKTDHGPGKTWKPPQPPPRGPPMSGREESYTRTARPVPPRPSGFDDFRESSGHHQRSHSSSAASRKGFMPNTPGGDEPPAPRGSYFTQRDKPKVAPDLPSRDSPPPMDNGGPDPLRQFREKEMPSMEPRISTPYATHGGEKLNPFESANINRSKSTRERTDTFDSRNGGSSPKMGEPNFKAPHRSRSFVENRYTSRAARASYNASIDLDSSSSDELPKTSSSGSRPSTKRGNNASRDAQPPLPPNANDASSTSKPSRISLFRQWMKENPNTEPPPNGFPPDGPPLRSGQAKTDANGNPSMYANSPFNCEKRSSIFEVKLPTVAEMLPSRPQCSTSKTEPSLPNSMKITFLQFGKSQPATPPSGVAIDHDIVNATDPQNLNAFETLQRNLVDGLLSNKQADSSGQEQQTAVNGSSASRCSDQAQPVNDNHAIQNGNRSTFRDSAEAGSPSKKFKPLKHLNSAHTYDSVKSQAFWVEHNERKRRANSRDHLSRFSFDFPNETFTSTRPQKNSFSSSAENISTKFTPEDWEGKFEAGGDYFRPEQKVSGNPPRGRTQSGSRSRGRSPIKVRPVPGPGDIPYMAPPTEPTPTESPGGTKFSAEEWAQTFKPQTFAPPANGPVPPRAAPQKKRTGPTLRTTMGGNAAVVDDGSSSEEKPLFMGRKPTVSPITVSPDPMDVDTPPVTNTVPQFTAAKINEKLSEPLKRPAASASSSPTDTASLKVGFDDLKIRDLINSLSIPTPPKPPSPPSPSQLASPSRGAFEDYVKRYANYMADWDMFDSKFLLHMVARKNQVDNIGEKRWTDERSTENYRLGIREDQAVLERWMEARAAHEGVVREFCIVRERMKGRVGRDDGGANIGGNGNGTATDRERTMRPSPRKKTH